MIDKLWMWGYHVDNNNKPTTQEEAMNSYYVFDTAYLKLKKIVGKKLAYKIAVLLIVKTS